VLGLLLLQVWGRSWVPGLAGWAWQEAQRVGPGRVGSKEAAALQQVGCREQQAGQQQQQGL
jgi:hypothetical protein